MTFAQQRYFCATAIAIMAAVVLRAAEVPSPWPAAISIYVYGLVAWPVVRDEMLPNVRPATYALMWAAASLFVIALENLGHYAGW